MNERQISNRHISSYMSYDASIIQEFQNYKNIKLNNNSYLKNIRTD